ncbi:MAG: hypothetical protein QF382_09180, partial [Acidimicrobiales bacterium]|nr:hypothetical protein [Acidimicrobiales bacterium]
MDDTTYPNWDYRRNGPPARNEQFGIEERIDEDGRRVPTGVIMHEPPDFDYDEETRDYAEHVHRQEMTALNNIQREIQIIAQRFPDPLPNGEGGHEIGPGVPDIPPGEPVPEMTDQQRQLFRAANIPYDQVPHRNPFDFEINETWLRERLKPMTGETRELFIHHTRLMGIERVDLENQGDATLEDQLRGLEHQNPPLQDYAPNPPPTPIHEVVWYEEPPPTPWADTTAPTAVPPPPPTTEEPSAVEGPTVVSAGPVGPAACDAGPTSDPEPVPKAKKKKKAQAKQKKKIQNLGVIHDPALPKETQCVYRWVCCPVADTHEEWYHTEVLTVWGGGTYVQGFRRCRLQVAYPGSFRCSYHQFAHDAIPQRLQPPPHNGGGGDDRGAYDRAPGPPTGPGGNAPPGPSAGPEPQGGPSTGEGDANTRYQKDMHTEDGEAEEDEELLLAAATAHAHLARWAEKDEEVNRLKRKQEIERLLDPEALLFDNEVIDEEGWLRAPRAAFELEPVFTVKDKTTIEEVVEDAKKARKDEELLATRIRALEWPDVREGELEARMTYLE